MALTTKAQVWDALWNKLSKIEKSLVEISFDLSPLDKNKLKRPEKIVNSAKRNAVKAGFIALDICSRCGGTGKFSWNARTGSECFKCHGHKKTLPATNAILQAVKKAAKNGEIVQH